MALAAKFFAYYSLTDTDEKLGSTHNIWQFYQSFFVFAKLETIENPISTGVACNFTALKFPKIYFLAKGLAFLNVKDLLFAGTLYNHSTATSLHLSLNLAAAP